MALAPFSYKKVNVGYASGVKVMSFTHTGEPGYCLHIPSEYALHVYDRLMTVGARNVDCLNWFCSKKNYAPGGSRLRGS